MSYLLNTWYVAAWAEELSTQPLARTLLETPVVLFRDPQGQAHALMDRCPHRFAPLSMGKVQESGALQCPYHGLQFGTDGRCVKNPHGDGSIPTGAVVRRFPLVERYSALWIWMGDAERADDSKIPAFPFNDPANWAVATNMMTVDAAYELESDNILDTSHIEFIHPLFASEAVSRAQLECKQDGDTVWQLRFMSNDQDPPPFIRQTLQVPEGPIDRWLDVRWDAPAVLALFIGGVAAGQPRESGTVLHQAHCFTPESKNRTHYFFSSAFPHAIGPMAESMAKQLVEGVRGPFEHEDKPMLEAVARRMGEADFWLLKPVILHGDAGGVRARRLLRQMIAKEQAAQAA